MNADGSGEQRVTHDNLEASAPSWSPRRRKIALYGRDGLYVIDADGADQRNVSHIGQRGGFFSRASR